MYIYTRLYSAFKLDLYCACIGEFVFNLSFTYYFTNTLLMYLTILDYSILYNVNQT
jgi:hypothetical protein